MQTEPQTEFKSRGKAAVMRLIVSADIDDFLTVRVGKMEVPPALYEVLALDSSGAKVKAGGRTYEAGPEVMAGYPAAGEYRLPVVGVAGAGGYVYGDRRFKDFADFIEWFNEDLKADRAELQAAIARLPAGGEG
jgi:hypothetical protein